MSELKQHAKAGGASEEQHEVAVPAILEEAGIRRVKTRSSLGTLRRPSRITSSV